MADFRKLAIRYLHWDSLLTEDRFDRLIQLKHRPDISDEQFRKELEDTLSNFGEYIVKEAFKSRARQTN